MFTRWSPLRVTLVYAAFGTAWILASDTVSSWLFPSLETLAIAQTAKGLLFIGVTATLVYWMVDRTAQDLRRNEARYSELFGDHPDPMFVVGRDGSILEVNRAAIEQYGYTRSELLAMKSPELALTALREQAANNLQRTSDAGAQFESRHQKKDGGEFPVEINARSIRLRGSLCTLLSVRDVTERHKAEEHVRLSEARYALAQRIAGVGTWEWDVATDRVLWTDEVYDIYGVPKGTPMASASDVEGRIHPEDVPRWHESLRACLEDGVEHNLEMRIVRPDGTVRWVTTLGDAQRDASGKALRVLGVVMDVTDRKQAEKERVKLEAQLRHAQKMEAVGRLAGGVAHDFNNILTAILGHIELSRASVPERTPATGPLIDAMGQIELSAERAAALTRQLLAFSRRQVARPRSISLSKVVTDLDKMLGRLIPATISLETDLEPKLQPVWADAGQFEQVIVNLVVNAVDAMPGGGRLTIRTGDVDIEEHGVIVPHVLLAVTDTGCGMDAETQERVFEPFFTTKPMHEGTGLGLSTVYGIVNQAGGRIEIDSEIGRGTTFRVYVPTAAESPDAAEDADASVPAAGGDETLLLCEDDAVVRDLLARSLRSAGYTVLVAEHPTTAVAIAQESRRRIDLLITDVIMPEMNGRDLALAVKAHRPDLPALFISGYPETVIGHAEVRDSAVELLHKPFTQAELLAHVRHILDSSRREAHLRS